MCTSCVDNVNFECLFLSVGMNEGGIRLEVPIEKYCAVISDGNF